MSKSICLNCKSTIQILKNKNQKYCSEKKCQNIRKNQWRKNKIKLDPEYLENKKLSNKKWQNKNKGYWRKYREKEPLYTLNNIKKQQMRRVNQVAKRDALSNLLSSNTNTYNLIPVNCDVAKRDALLVKITLNTNSYQQQDYKV
jgi:hypothetical protein